MPKTPPKSDTTSKVTPSHKGDKPKEDRSIKDLSMSSKLKATEGISMLRFDNMTVVSFAKFEQDLKIVAGQEFGELFAHVMKGNIPTLTVPYKDTFAKQKDRSLAELKELVNYFGPPKEDEPNEVTEGRAAAEKALKRQEDHHSSMSTADIEEIDEILREKFKVELKEVTSQQFKWKSDAPKLYWMIRRNMSEESTDKIRQHLGLQAWAQSEASLDPVVLWKAIKDTHSARNTGNSMEDQLFARNTYNNVKMEARETITNLHRRLLLAADSIERTSGTRPSELQLAQDFIYKLDDRWADLRQKLSNDQVQGLDTFPKTLSDAYEHASRWKIVATNSKGFGISVFATTHKKAEQESDLKKKGSTKDEDKNLDTKPDERKSNKLSCYLCGETNHTVKDCPFKDTAKSAVKVAKESENKGEKNSGQDESKAKKKSHATIASGFTTFTFNANSLNSNDWLRNRILFDPQAQSHIFCNEEYISELEQKDDRIAYTGLVPGHDYVDMEGTFMGKINVDFNPEFATNLLSGAQCREDGYDWGYDFEGDFFWLVVGDRTLKFTPEERLYTFDPSKATSFAFVLTKAEEAKAKEAQELIKTLGYPSSQRLIKAIQNGAITGIKVTVDDIRRAETLYGKPAEYLAGKSVWKKPKLPLPIEVGPGLKEDLIGHVDLMFLGKNTFIIGVYKPIDLTIVTPLADKFTSTKVKALKEHLAILNTHGFRVKSYHSDAGDDFEECCNLAGGPGLSPLPPGRKDGVVESKVRRLKETTRCVVHSLKFPLSDILIKYAVMFAGYMSNLFPTRNGYQGISPREALTGVKVDAKTHLPCGFGEFCWVVDKDGNNTINKRTFAGISLIPSGRSGGVNFLNIEKGSVVIRDQFNVAKEIPNEYLQIISSFASYSKEQVMSLLGPSDVLEDDDDESKPNGAEGTITFSTMSEMEEEAEMKEFTQFKEKGVLQGVGLGTKIDPKEIIPLKLFTKPKFDSEGNVTVIKSRGVARGDLQVESIYERRGSPTASVQSIFTLVALADHEKKRICTYDVPGAYLNAERPGRAPNVYIRLNKRQTQLMTRVDPGWKKFIQPDGSSIGLSIKALYGLVESGSLWNENADRDLKEMGFKRSQYDPCVYFKDGVRLALYVDDMLITYQDEDDIEEMKAFFLKKYGGSFKYPVQGEIEFLGMKLELTKDGVRVSMPSKIDDVLEGVKGTSETPAGLGLFAIDENSKKLDPDDKKRFHTVTAKLLYMAKRTRPDILLAVNFLTTRVNEPTFEDQTKLQRVLKYLNSTRDRGLLLKIGKTVHVHAYVDASYGVHEVDGKSHSGAMIGVGDALAINVKSSKQKIVTKSSTEAELVAVTDMASEIIDLKCFVEELGYHFGPSTLYQDNTSTIHLLTNDFVSSSRSKHIRVRTFWIREKVQEGVIDVVHVTTEKMLADGLTKPLQGNAFKAFRDVILGGKFE